LVALVFGAGTKLQGLVQAVTFGCVKPGCLVHDNQSVEIEVQVKDKDQAVLLIEQATESLQIELALLSNRPSLAQPGLLLMDMDSTVIAVECIDEIAKLAGVGEQVSTVTAKAMRGELDFAQSLNERVGCLKGADVAILEQVKNALPIMPGIPALLKELKNAGWKLAIASGGFTFFADYLGERLELDYTIANQLGVENGQLTGEVISEIVTAQTKADTLLMLAKKWDIPKQQTIALGDGANDLVMMEAAGLGVALHAKPIVRQKADSAIRFGGADSLLCLLLRE
jgi:phosphoserine phosphatase